MTKHPFRVAVEAGDLDAAIALLADDVVFRSPVAHRPYQGRAAVGEVLRAVFVVFQQFRYLRELRSADDVDHALVFAARVGDRELEGCDFLRMDANGAVTELVVMVRPLSGLGALAEAMAAQLGASRGDG